MTRRTRHVPTGKPRTANGPVIRAKRAGQNRKYAGQSHSVQNGADFWNREYTSGEHFSLSDKPGSELVKFARWFRREQAHMDFSMLNVLDVGCGNGRNLLYLADQYDAAGSGFDLSASAIASAEKAAIGFNLTRPVRFYVHNLADIIPEPDGSVGVVLDMMVSHCLNRAQRLQYRAEIKRVLEPGGFVMIKTFLREGDEHAKKLIAEHPAGEEGSYIHPMIGIYEHVTTEKYFRDFWDEDFIIHLLHKSHGYQHWGGTPYKRRYMVAYLEKKPE
jgi:SAM-dependent methyltransferase